MHREISHVDPALRQESNLSLYLLTGLLGLLIGADLWPQVATWLAAKGLALPTWSPEVLGYRIALIAAVIGGARVLYGSLEGLLEGRIGADLALAIATIAAILINEPLVAAEVVFIGMVGECLESITFERTQRAIRKIVEVCPRRCWLLRDGQEVRVLTSEVQVGDRVVVKPGGRVPVDGVIMDGRSAVDQSALTGESLPADKGPGDEVLAGSLNQFGALTIEARRVAEYTVVGRVIELTARALKDKAPLERTADRLARYFLPAVLGIAAVTFLVALIWHMGPFRTADGRLDFGQAVRLSVYPTLAVLVVACPCALILATPAAVVAALGRLAGTGVLIKGGSALERLAGVTVFAFDKTGTLTEGRLELGDVIGLSNVSADEVLRTAATAEQRSEHPVARLVLQEASSRGLQLEPVAQFLAHPGAGVTVMQESGTRIIVGTRRLLEELGIPLVTTLLERLDASGQTALLVARDGVVLGVIGARDRVRPEAAGVIAELRAAGVQDIALLTGDRAAAAQAVAATVGITQVYAELLPEQKAELVGSGQWAAGSKKTEHPSLPTAHYPLPTAFVGDGINDAPALARAAVGVAIGGTGTDVAAEAGDVVLMGEPLRPLPLLVKLSREMVRIIRQNILIFAFAVNGLGILLTAWLWPILLPGWYEQAPLAGVIYHQVGSLAVLLNAMRLLWFERTATSPAWTRARMTVQNIDHWMEHHVNADEALHWLSHRWKLVALAAAAIGLVAYALSGLLIVGPNEIAVVRQFGRPVADLEPGLYWRWPWPVEDVTRIEPDRVRTVEIGFRTVPGANSAVSSRSWASPHSGDGIRRIPDESVMITGDGNLVELQATVRYSVARERSQLHTFLFDIEKPEDIIRGAAESALREAVAGQPFLELLTVNRQQFQETVRTRLEKRCRQYGRNGVGIQLDGLSLHDLHPPQEVVDAYHEVARAMETRDRQINEAQGEALKEKRRAEAQALRVVREAQAASHKTVQDAEAERDAFLARLRTRSELSLTEEWRLLSEAASAVAAGQDARVAFQLYQRRRTDQIALQKFLTDFRLSMQMLANALQGRDKIIVDTEKVPGRRHLLLFDPDWFRPPPAMLLTPERSPRRPMGESHDQ